MEVIMTSRETVKISVRLLEEGVPTARPTQALSLGNGLYRILPTPDYDPEDEVWEFLPGSIVRCKMVSGEFLNDVFLAVEKVG
jgi:hypothetical protein